MRSKPTGYEYLFKERLVKGGWNFKQQMILGWYILDFVIPEKMIVFEIDGASHKNRVYYDNKRDEFVKECGFTTIRIQNHNVEKYELNFMTELPNRMATEFRSGLGKGNSLMGHTKFQLKEN